MLEYLKEILCNKPILQFPDPKKHMYCIQTHLIMHIQVSFANHLTMTQDIRPVAYFSGTFTAQNRSWCATEKEAYAVLKSVQHFDYYL